MVRFCEQCLQLRPTCTKALSRRGLARVQLGEYTAALSDILHALDLIPADDVAERERVKIIMLKAKRGLQEQNKSLEKRKASMQKAFADKDGGIGDSRVKPAKSVVKQRLPVQAESIKITDVFLLLSGAVLGVLLAYYFVMM